MSTTNRNEPTLAQLFAVIATQAEVAKSGLDLSNVMTLVAERVLDLTPACGAVVELVEGDDMVYHAVAGTASETLGLRLKKQTSLSGLCVTTGQTQICQDSEADPRVDREACRRVGLRSMVVVPLIHQSNTVGALKVYSEQVDAFTEADIQVLSLMSEVIAAAMYNATKYGAEELFRQATRDSLTGLANRTLYLDRLRHTMDKSKRNGKPFAILVIDMDGLKPINDVYGHRAGDAALKEIANRLLAQSRQADTVARFGGDEFAMILADVKDHESARSALARITDFCTGHFEYGGNQLPIGVSAGLAIFPNDGDDPESLLEHADQLMYTSKRGKKGFKSG